MPAQYYHAPANQFDRLANSDLCRAQAEDELASEAKKRFGFTIEEMLNLSDPEFQAIIQAVTEEREERTQANLREIRQFHQLEITDQDLASPPVQTPPEWRGLNADPFDDDLSYEDAQLEQSFYWQEIQRKARTVPDDAREFRRRTGKPVLAGHLVE